jgi:hypothetical protein
MARHTAEENAGGILRSCADGELCVSPDGIEMVDDGAKDDATGAIAPLFRKPRRSFKRSFKL